MPEVKLDMDLYVGLGLEGPYTTLYVGDGDTPALEHEMTWEEIISNEIDYHTVPSQKYIPYEELDDLNRPFDLVRTLRVVADELESRLLQLDGFDRKAWLEHTESHSIFDDKTKFTKPLKELLNYES